MKVAQVAPLIESVPPKCYGGTERVIAYLTQELIQQGHEVTLFASADSQTQAELVSVCDQAIRLDPNPKDSWIYHYLLMEALARRSTSFDIIHFHLDFVSFPLCRRIYTPSLHTLHGRLDLPDLVPLHREFTEMQLVSISDAQRRALPWANWQGTVYHGLPEELYPLGPGGGGYLAFLGRISREKRADLAIQIAVKAGMKIKIAAKIDAADQTYFQSVRHLFDHPLVEFLGEIPDREKSSFLGAAEALLFPIDWPEPFGLVMIEAMACGTPVIARAGGSVSEVIRPGENGFIIDTPEEGAAAISQLHQIKRSRCQEYFKENFSARRMAHDYLDLYQRLIELHGAARPILHTG